MRAERRDVRRHQVLLRLSDTARASLDDLVKRWECSEGVLLQSVIVQLARRHDLRSPLDLSGNLSHVTLLRRCRDALDRAITSAEKNA